MFENALQTRQEADRNSERATACPACGEPVEEVKPIGPISYVLQPCGHQVDARVYDDHLQ